MEKILVALDPQKPNTNLVEFACYLAALTRSELIALYLHHSKEERVLEKAGQEASTAPGAFAGLAENGPAATVCDTDPSQFEAACRNRGVRIRVHRDAREPLSVILNESRYADMLVVDAGMSFDRNDKGNPTDFMKEVLTRSECPVVVAPYAFNGIEEILFAYDGSASSTFAIKQFVYLFPELSDLRLTIMQVSKEQVPVVERQKLIEFLQAHYSSIGFRVAEGNADEELLKFLQDRKFTFLVMGAFGRSYLSRRIRKSTAELLMSSVNLPLFIAHNH